MPKRLSDITHAYERSAADLETAQDELTVATEHYRSKVEAASQAHREADEELLHYLRAHPNDAVVSNDHAYRLSDDGDLIARHPIFWAHHVWIETPEPAPTYRVPAGNGEPDMVARANALSAAWALGSEDPAEEAAS